MMITRLLPLVGAAAALAIGLSAPAAAIPTGCTNATGGSGSPNNGTWPGGTGTGAGALNKTGGMLGDGAASFDNCRGGAASDEFNNRGNHTGNIGGQAGGGIPLDQH
jgi:hypothetical protein